MVGTFPMVMHLELVQMMRHANYSISELIVN